MSELPRAEAPANNTPASGGGDDTTYDVHELLAELTETVEAAFPDEIWIRGQIRNLHRSRKGHVYFDLVTPTPADRNPPAVLPVVLFDWYRKIVNRILGAGAAGQMIDGVEVRIRGSVSVYKARGQVQLQMKTIDPAYTLSRLDDQRDRLLGELKAAGLLERNRALPLPTLPLRVALVTSAGSAAEADFRNVLAAGGIGWEILVADTPVQGFGSEQRIAAAVALAGQQAVDVIALVRGGGARTELAPFDSAAVAQAIAQSAAPVLTGIGHEIDRSVADVVAHTACSTPTACAAALVAQAGRFDRATLALWRRIEDAVDGRLAGDRHRLADAAQRAGAAFRASCRGARSEMRRLALGIDRVARHGAERARWHLDAQHVLTADRITARLAGQRRLLASAAGRLSLDTAHALETRRRQLDALDAQVRAYDPQRALERGWTITTDGAGRLLRSVADIAPGATLRTRMRDGTVTSTATAVASAETTGSEDG
ncbi:MAG: exodeoxyribonuclease VII large subunit [bacterium]|nr:exodeoxyribonuclease VII large subunit [bacterium]